MLVKQTVLPKKADRAVLFSRETPTTYWSRPGPSPIGEERFYALHPNLPRHLGPDGKEYVIPYLEDCKKWMAAFQVADLGWYDALKWSVDPSTYYLEDLSGKRVRVRSQNYPRYLTDVVRNDYPQLREFAIDQVRLPRNFPTAPPFDERSGLMATIIEACTGRERPEVVVFDLGMYVDARNVYAATGCVSLVVSPKAPKGDVPSKVFLSRELVLKGIPKGSRVLILTNDERKRDYASIAHSAGVYGLMMHRSTTLDRLSFGNLPDHSKGPSSGLGPSDVGPSGVGPSDLSHYVIINLAHPDENWVPRQDREFEERTNARRTAYVVSLNPKVDGLLLPDTVGAVLSALRVLKWTPERGYPPYGELLTLMERMGFFGGTLLKPGRAKRQDLGVDEATRAYLKIGKTYLPKVFPSYLKR